MSNVVALTKSVDKGELYAQMVSAGVASSVKIDARGVCLYGPAWDAMDAAAQAAELAKVTAAMAAHAPTTVTETTISQAPHAEKFASELTAVAGVTSVAYELPSAYPGTCRVFHNPLTSGQQAALAAAITAHDPSAVPSLSLDVSDLQVSGNNVATGTITVTDSRGAGASGVLVDVVPPQQPIALDKTQITLDASGVGTLVFGPSPATGYVSGKMPVGFRYNSGIGDGADATCQYV